MVDRISHRDSLIPECEAAFRTRPAEEWLEALIAADIPAGPINDLSQVFADPHVQARGMTVTMPHALGVPAELLASPIRYAAEPVHYDLPPPLLGEHTDEILTDLLGMGADEVASLRERGIV